MPPPTSTKAAPKVRKSTQDVEQTLKEVLAFHRKGKIVEGAVGPDAKVNTITAYEPDAHKASILRSARTFAKAYTQTGLESFIKACRREGFALGTTAMTYLSQVPDKVARAAIQDEAIRGHWTGNHLKDQILARIGHQKSDVGRRPKRIHTRAELLRGLSKFCGKWQRYEQGIRRDQADIDINPTLEDGIKAVNEAVGILRNVVERQLKQSRKA